MKLVLTVCFTLLCATFIWAAHPSDFIPPHSNEDETNINMKFYHIDVEFDLEKPFLSGAVYMEFVATQPNVKDIALDIGEGLKVTKVEGASEFKQKGEQLMVTLDTEPLEKEARFQIKVFYEGTPVNVEVEVDGAKVKKGLIYKERGAEGKKNLLIVTAAYPQLGYKWFPCKRGIGDKVDSIYVDVTIAKKTGLAEIKGKEQKIPYQAVSNGVLEAVVKVDEDKLKFKWRHRHRIAPHHVVVAISNFAKVEGEYSAKGEQFPLNFYVLPENLEQSQATMQRCPEIMACLTRTFGSYPFIDEGFSVIETGLQLGLDGMPTQTAVLVEDLKSFHMYQVVHQAAAMWFGNHISPEEWQDAWIPEALATYAEAMWQEYKRGLNVLQIIMDEKEYFEGGKLYLENEADYSKERLSKKGMYAIHMLRGMMGDTYFFEALKGITGLKRSRSTYISTKKFQEICEYYASENIDRKFGFFFDQWVYGEFFPIYNVTWEIPKKGELKVTVRQEKRETQPNLFKMPYKVRIVFTDGTVREETIDMNDVKGEAVEVFTFKVDKEVKEFLFDPANWIFKELQYTRQVMSTKWPITDMKIETSQGRRKVDVSFNVQKKQDIKIELLRKADGVKLTEDELVNTQVLEKANGEKTMPFKIPVGVKDRDVFILRISGKSDVYTKELRIVQLEEKFR